MLFWCCCSCSTTVIQTVYGCNGTALSGVTVNVKVGGSTIGTGTTNGSGVATITVTSAVNASADVEVVAPTGFVTNTGTVTLNCGTVTRSTTLSVDTAYYVCCSECAYPVERTLYLTVAGQTITMTRTGGASLWSGSGTFTISSSDECHGGTTVVISFEMGCQSGGVWTLTLSAFGTCLGVLGPFYGFCYGSSFGGGSPSVIYTTATVSSSCPRPLSLTFSVSSTWDASGVCPSVTLPANPASGTAVVTP